MQNEIIKYELIDQLTETQVISKETIENTAKELASREYSAKEKLVIRTQVKALKNFAEVIEKNLPVSESELKLTGNVLGASIIYGDNVKYDYSCDQQWNSLDALKKDRETQLKTQYELHAKHIANGGKPEEFTGVVIDGEQLPIIKKNVTSGIKITLSK